jgi:hypothetical protein
MALSSEALAPATNRTVAVPVSPITSRLPKFVPLPIVVVPLSNVVSARRTACEHTASKTTSVPRRDPTRTRGAIGTMVAETFLCRRGAERENRQSYPTTAVAPQEKSEKGRIRHEQGRIRRGSPADGFRKPSHPEPRDHRRGAA